MQLIKLPVGYLLSLTLKKSGLMLVLIENNHKSEERYFCLMLSKDKFAFSAFQLRILTLNSEALILFHSLQPSPLTTFLLLKKIL